MPVVLGLGADVEDSDVDEGVGASPPPPELPPPPSLLLELSELPCDDELDDSFELLVLDESCDAPFDDEVDDDVGDEPPLVTDPRLVEPPLTTGASEPEPRRARR